MIQCYFYFDIVELLPHYCCSWM